MKEIFVDIIGYEGLYQVSNFGRVKSLPKKINNGIGFAIRPEKILKLDKSNRGYLRIRLHNNYTTERFLVHRLVAYHFIPNTENKPTVNHRNGIKIDNNIENLEWATLSENMQHGFDIGIHKPSYGPRASRSIDESKIKELKIVYERGGISIRKLASEHGIDHRTLYYNIVKKPKKYEMFN